MMNIGAHISATVFSNISFPELSEIALKHCSEKNSSGKLAFRLSDTMDFNPISANNELLTLLKRSNIKTNVSGDNFSIIYETTVEKELLIGLQFIGGVPVSLLQIKKQEQKVCIVGVPITVSEDEIVSRIQNVNSAKRVINEIKGNIVPTSVVLLKFKGDPPEMVTLGFQVFKVKMYIKDYSSKNSQQHAKGINHTIQINQSQMTRCPNIPFSLPSSINFMNLPLNDATLEANDLPTPNHPLTPVRPQPPYWTEECQAAVKAKNKALRVYRKDKSGVSREIYKRKKAQAQFTINNAKRMFLQES